jgi:hypothetical protein
MFLRQNQLKVLQTAVNPESCFELQNDDFITNSSQRKQVRGHEMFSSVCSRVREIACHGNCFMIPDEDVHTQYHEVPTFEIIQLHVTLIEPLSRACLILMRGVNMQPSKRFIS